MPKTTKLGLPYNWQGGNSTGWVSPQSGGGNFLQGMTANRYIIDPNDLDTIFNPFNRTIFNPVTGETTNQQTGEVINATGGVKPVRNQSVTPTVITAVNIPTETAQQPENKAISFIKQNPLLTLAVGAGLAYLVTR